MQCFQVSALSIKYFYTPSPPSKRAIVAVTKMETFCRNTRVKRILEFYFINSFNSYKLCYINCNFDNKAAENKSSLVSCVGVWLCLYKFRYPHYFISVCLSMLSWISMVPLCTFCFSIQEKYHPAIVCKACEIFLLGKSEQSQFFSQYLHAIKLAEKRGRRHGEA